MSVDYTILILEDEPLILMDMELAGRDRGCSILSATSCADALAILEQGAAVDVAILDVSLGQEGTCLPVADQLKSRCVPFLLHSGDLDRHDEQVRSLDAPLIAKPAVSERVIAAAIALFEGDGDTHIPLAAE